MEPSGGEDGGALPCAPVSGLGDNRSKLKQSLCRTEALTLAGGLRPASWDLGVVVVGLNTSVL